MPDLAESSAPAALVTTERGTFACPRCDWLHVEVHAGYACPCIPCDKCATTGQGQWAGSACNRCGGRGYRIPPLAERLTKAGEVTDGRG